MCEKFRQNFQTRVASQAKIIWTSVYKLFPLSIMFSTGAKYSNKRAKKKLIATIIIILTIHFKQLSQALLPVISLYLSTIFSCLIFSFSCSIPSFPATACQYLPSLLYYTPLNPDLLLLFFLLPGLIRAMCRVCVFCHYSRD